MDLIIPPCSNSIISVQKSRVFKRWAITKIVMSLLNSFIDSITAFSVSPSNALVASSKTITSASLYSALAIPIL